MFDGPKNLESHGGWFIRPIVFSLDMDTAHAQLSSFINKLKQCISSPCKHFEQGGVFVKSYI